MTAYKNVKIPAAITDIVDTKLVEGGNYSSRAEYVKECIRNDLRRRGIEA